MSEKVELYGIKSCDTMKKAQKWLKKNKIEYTFHDLKKEGANDDVLCMAVAQNGWDKVINKRGTTWRNLPKEVKEQMDEFAAIRVALQEPTIIKRPLLVRGEQSSVGFKEDLYEELFKEEA